MTIRTSQTRQMLSKPPKGGRQADFTYNEIGKFVAYDFMRYFWDGQFTQNFGTIAGCARPFQYNFAIEDRNQPLKKSR